MLGFLFREAPSAAHAHQGGAIMLPLVRPPRGLDRQITKPGLLAAAGSRSSFQASENGRARSTRKQSGALRVPLFDKDELVTTLLFQRRFDLHKPFHPVLAVMMQLGSIFAVRNGLRGQTLAVFAHGDLALEPLCQMTDRPFTQNPDIHDWEAQPAL